MGFFTSKRAQVEKIEKDLEDYCDNRQALTRLEHLFAMMPEQQRKYLLELFNLQLSGTMQIGFTTVILDNGKITKVEGLDDETL